MSGIPLPVPTGEKVPKDPKPGGEKTVRTTPFLGEK
jgi:hypothetical protein